MIGSMGAPTLITRATNDVQQVIQFITFLFTAIIAAPMMFIGGLVLALSQSVKLSVVLLVTIPLLLGGSVVFLKLILPYYREQQTKIDEMNTVLVDQISGIRVVKAFTKEQGEKERFERINGDLSRINTSIGKITGLMQPIFTLDNELCQYFADLVWRPYGGERSCTDWTGDRLRNLHILYSDSNPDGFHDFYYAAKSRGIGYTY
ncbi:MAG: ABC transporter transmembrane domain-containing protein [Blautia faecis]